MRTGTIICLSASPQDSWPGNIEHNPRYNPVIALTCASMFLLPDFRELNESSRLPNISLYRGQCVLRLDLNVGITNPRSANALLSRVYRSPAALEVDDAIFCVSCSPRLAGLLDLARPSSLSVLLLTPGLEEACGLGIGRSGPATVLNEIVSVALLDQGQTYHARSASTASALMLW